MVLVVDASAIVEVLRRTRLGGKVADLMRAATTLSAPAHLDAEVLSAFGRLARNGTADAASAAVAVRQLVRLPVQRLPLQPLVQRAWALRESVALRDGLYVACAEMLEATLLTLDGRLARSAPVPVEHLA